VSQDLPDSGYPIRPGAVFLFKHYAVSFEDGDVVLRCYVCGTQLVFPYNTTTLVMMPHAKRHLNRCGKDDAPGT